jgi:hypothetical protein
MNDLKVETSNLQKCLINPLFKVVGCHKIYTKKARKMPFLAIVFPIYRKTSNKVTGRSIFQPQNFGNFNLGLLFCTSKKECALLEILPLRANSFLRDLNYSPFLSNSQKLITKI